MSEPTVWAKAKAEIQRRGWYQGGLVPDQFPEGIDLGNCRVCLVGSVAAGLCGNPLSNPIEMDFVPVWRHLHAMGFTSQACDIADAVGEWNDTPGRTVDEVYALLDRLDAEEQAR